MRRWDALVAIIVVVLRVLGQLDSSRSGRADSKERSARSAARPPAASAYIRAGDDAEEDSLPRRLIGPVVLAVFVGVVIYLLGVWIPSALGAA